MSRTRKKIILIEGIEIRSRSSLLYKVTEKCAFELSESSIRGRAVLSRSLRVKLIPKGKNETRFFLSDRRISRYTLAPSKRILSEARKPKGAAIYIIFSFWKYEKDERTKKITLVRTYCLLVVTINM